MYESHYEKIEKIVHCILQVFEFHKRLEYTFAVYAKLNMLPVKHEY